MDWKRRFSGSASWRPAVLSGLLLALAFPRPQLWPLAMVSLIPLAATLPGRGRREAFRLGYITGLVQATILVYWINYALVTYGGLPVWVAVPVFFLLTGYMALYPGLFALGLVLGETRLGFKPGRPLWIMAGAALFTGLEYFKGFFLTGFPWEPLGGALASALPLVQAADIVGTGGLTLAVVLVNLTLAAAFIGTDRPWPRRILVPAAIAAVVPLLLLAYGYPRLNAVQARAAQAETRQAAIVQASIDQGLKWDPDHRVSILKTYRDLTATAAADRPWLIVWPETAVPFFFDQDRPATEWLVEVVRRLDTPLLFGSPAYTESGDETHYYNRAYLVSGRGETLGWYDKIHLVPYGEYVPFKDLFPFIGKITRAVGDYVPGTPGRLPELDGRKLGVLICYESIFPELARAHILDGADFLVILTNDAWYGRTSAPYQHFSQAILRAVETRRSVIRAANSGISGYILPTGRTVSTLGLFEPGVLTGEIPRLTDRTVYVRVGDIIPKVCLAVVAAIFGIGYLRRKDHVNRP